MNEEGKDLRGQLLPPLPVKMALSRSCQDRLGLFVGINSNADQEVGLFTRLHTAGSPFGRNAFIIHILGLFITKRHTHAHMQKKRGVITHHESHAYLANHYETV